MFCTVNRFIRCSNCDSITKKYCMLKFSVYDCDTYDTWIKVQELLESN